MRSQVLRRPRWRLQLVLEVKTNETQGHSAQSQTMNSVV